jgi:hypothetical protein
MKKEKIENCTIENGMFKITSVGDIEIKQAGASDKNHIEYIELVEELNTRKEAGENVNFAKIRAKLVYNSILGNRFYKGYIKEDAKVVDFVDFAAFEEFYSSLPFSVTNTLSEIATELAFASPVEKKI